MAKVFKFLMVFIVLLFIGTSTIATSSQIFPRFYRKTRSPLGKVIKNPIQKCHCGPNQVWNLKCEDKKTFLPMIDFEPFTKSVVNTGIFREIIVAQTKCQVNELTVPLSVGSFYLLETGELFHMLTGVKFGVGKYCVEHVKDFAFNKIRLGAVACVPRPQIPLCCPEKQVLKSRTFTCENATDISFSPPIFKEPLFLKWDGVVGPHTGLPQCYDNEIYQQFNLDRGDHSVLLYRSDKIVLHWMTNPYNPYYFVPPEEFCVALEDTGKGYLYSAYICIEPVRIEDAFDSTRDREKKAENLFIFPSVVFG